MMGQCSACPCLPRILWDRCFVPHGRIATDPSPEVLRRLPYPHALPSDSTGISLGIACVISERIGAFLGQPPPYQVSIFEVDAFPYSHSVKVWCPVSGHGKSLLLDGHTDTVLCVAMNGNTVVTGSYDRTCRVWDASRGTLLWTILCNCAVTAVAIERTTLVIGGSRGEVVVGKLEGDNGTTRTLSFQAEEASRRLQARCSHLRGHTRGVLAAALRDGMLATGSSDKTARIWDAGSGRLCHTLVGHRGGIQAVAMHRNLQLLVTGSLDATAKLWNCATGKLLHTFSTAFAARGRHRCLDWLVASDSVLAVAMEGDLVVTGSERGEVRVCNRKTGKSQLLAERDVQGPLGSRMALAARADGIVIACWKGGFAKIWDTATGLPPSVVTGGFQTHVGRPSYAVLV